MAEAICVRCGKTKRQPWEKCRRCHFDPKSDEEALVKSVFLSVGRFSTESEQTQYRRELDRFADALESGETIAFPEAELARLRAQKELIDQTPISAAWGAVFRLFLPAIVIILLLLAVAQVLKVSK